MISPRGRALRTSFSAASFASAPELQKNTASPNDRSTSRSASRTIGALKYRFDTCIEPPRLLLDRRHHVRMAVAGVADRHAREEVQVLDAVGVHEHASRP